MIVAHDGIGTTTVNDRKTVAIMEEYVTTLMAE